MKIRLVAYGIAREILKQREMEFESSPGETIATLKLKLFRRFPEFAQLKSLSFAIGESYQEDSYALHEDDEVVIIPPVNGG